MASLVTPLASPVAHALRGPLADSASTCSTPGKTFAIRHCGGLVEAQAGEGVMVTSKPPVISGTAVVRIQRASMDRSL